MYQPGSAGWFYSGNTGGGIILLLPVFVIFCIFLERGEIVAHSN